MTLSQPGTLGLDFGTSNSAMAWAPPKGVAQLLQLEGQATAIPTAVFYNAEADSTHFGRDAITHYLEGTEGRLMRSLKSLLGSALLQETTAVNHRQVNFQDIIATFLAMLQQRATQTLGKPPSRVVMGRPVHFVDDDPVRDAQAQASLLQAAESVGFEDISFQLEPIAAALDYERRLTREKVVLVADIGGGTSDFTVVRLGPERMVRADRSSDVLATRGVHIGGTDFDQQLSLERVMPLLGYRHVGAQHREVPNRVFFDLSSWHLVHWLYQPRALAQAQALRTNYSDESLHRRLMQVLNQRQGHHIAHEVEQAKIAGSLQGADTTIHLSCIEPGLLAPLRMADMQSHLNSLLTRVVNCASECVHLAGLGDNRLDTIYLTGGSCALKPFQLALQARFKNVEIIEGDLLGGVASGLALTQ